MPTTSIACPSRIASTGIFAPGWPISDEARGPDDDLGAPPVTELADVLDAAGDRHQAPRMRGRELPVDPEGRGRGSGAESLDRCRPQARGTVRGSHPPDGPDPRADARRRDVLREQDLDRTGRVLDDDPPAGRVEEGSRSGDDGLDGHVPIRDAQGAGYGDRLRVRGRAGGRSRRRRPGVLRRRHREGDGEADGAATSCTSAGSRSQTRYPSSAPLSRLAGPRCRSTGRPRPWTRPSRRCRWRRRP